MPHSLPPLRIGHHLRLLQGATQFIPALTEAIDAAREEVRLETYIFDFQGQGVEVAYALERAARRAVDVKVVVDGFGTPPLPPAWAERFLDAGIDWRVYSPLGRFGVLNLGSWRRLHRKLALIDGRIGFCGGINVLDDEYDQSGPTHLPPRLDFSVQVTGPLVDEIGLTMRRLWLRMEAMRDIRGARLTGALHSLRASGRASVPPVEKLPAPDGRGARAALVLRDNLRNRTRIERAYLRAIGRAREEIVIANAYFIPGRKMRRALVTAARRGVKVILLLQGRYESFMQFYASRSVYGTLLRAGVQIHEYSPTLLHCKVAVIDGRWATVGSTNLDPLSLLLAREANVVVEDEEFAGQLRSRLLDAISQHGVAVEPQIYMDRPLKQRVLEWVGLTATRLAILVQGKNYL
jgi:cardiolipin synthase A/B